MSETKAMSDDAGVGPTSREDRLRPVVGELARITATIQYVGSLALLLTLVVVVSSAIGSMLIDVRRPPTMGESMPAQALFALGMVGLAFFNIVLLIGYERLHKRGDTLFEEISDELSGFSSSPRGGLPSEILKVMPPIDVRVALRSFTREVDLPLVPGRLGPAAYGLVNLLIIILVTFWGLF